MIGKVTAAVQKEIIVEKQHLSRLLHEFKYHFPLRSCTVKRLHCCLIFRCVDAKLKEPNRDPREQLLEIISAHYDWIIRTEDVCYFEAAAFLGT
jgi:hypothetical protein